MPVSWQSGAVFVFCNKARTRIKLLRWDNHGVWLAMRRLHKGSFPWPKSDVMSWQLSAEQFNWLIKGINWQHIEGQTLSQWQ
jgi:transposase